MAPPKLASAVWQIYVNDTPAQGPYQPSLADIQTWGKYLESFDLVGAAGGTVDFQSPVFTPALNATPVKFEALSVGANTGSAATLTVNSVSFPIVVNGGSLAAGMTGPPNYLMKFTIVGSNAVLHNPYGASVGGISQTPAPSWNSATSYVVPSQVSDAGSIWGSLTPSTNQRPSTTSGYWYLVAGVTGGTLNTKLTLTPSLVGGAGFSYGAPGAAPTVKSDGDSWLTSGGLFVRLGGIDKQVMLGNGAMPTGSVFVAGVVSDAVQRSFTGAGSVIPFDSTVPLVTEGSSLLSVAVTPLAAVNKLKARATIQMASLAAGNNVAIAVFDGSTCIGATIGYCSNAYSGITVALETDFVVAGSTTARTYSVRVGQIASGGTIFTGGHSSGLTLGGAAIKSTLVIEEVVG